ncbi:MAG: hypothetical protein JOZ31_12840 [Verrucomicrobia bacterium]|nr:hypothetical protein [Verrucomicrobiota bacterium]MBV8485354.1 hypothetical protein [Verrucomicrobiota bacterium]
MEVILETHRVFLLSPANVVGRRAQILLNTEAPFALARRLHAGDAVTLGEAFSFMSGLYFRGKLAYARAFAHPPQGLAGAYAITSNRGLLPVDTVITTEELGSFAGAPIDVQNKAYSEPLVRTALALANACPSNCPVILLGSIASRKYTDHLLPVFGSNLHFPLEFVGRGDMSRGGLLLRSAAANQMLNHVPIAGALLRGERPPKLTPVKTNRRTGD